MQARDEARFFDPICGMWLRAGDVAVTFTFVGHTYAFCCTECRDLFARAPEVHVSHLAHEPHACAGHLCPFKRRGNTGSGFPDRGSAG